MARSSSLTSRRMEVPLRAVTSIFGGYVLATAFVLCFRRLAPLGAGDATQLGVMIAFVLYAVVAVWCFSVQSLTRALAGVLLPAALLTAMAWALAEGMA